MLPLWGATLKYCALLKKFDIEATVHCYSNGWNLPKEWTQVEGMKIDFDKTVTVLKVVAKRMPRWWVIKGASVAFEAVSRDRQMARKPVANITMFLELECLDMDVFHTKSISLSLSKTGSTLQLCRFARFEGIFYFTVIVPWSRITIVKQQRCLTVVTKSWAHEKTMTDHVACLKHVTR